MGVRPGLGRLLGRPHAPLHLLQERGPRPPPGRAPEGAAPRGRPRLVRDAAPELRGAGGGGATLRHPLGHARDPDRVSGLRPPREVRQRGFDGPRVGERIGEEPLTQAKHFERCKALSALSSGRLEEPSTPKPTCSRVHRFW